jgi:quercetin dioxygenase-like cupin family protein
MVFRDLKTLKLEAFRPGIMSQAAMGDGLIMVCMEIAQGREDLGHQHPFDQCGMVLEGRIEMFIDPERRGIGAGESYFIPAGVRHGWKTFEKPAKLLDVSSRPR